LKTKRPSLKRGLLVYNPIAGPRDRREQMNALINRQRERGLELVNAPTAGVGDATEIVRSFLKKGLDLVVVCGGDGTISEAACGLEGSEVPLAVLPGGTSNVLARELQIPLDFDAAEELLQDGLPSPIRFAHADGRPFLLWAGAGLDARVMSKVNVKLKLKRWLGRTGISLTAMTEFLRYEFPRLEVVVDGVSHQATFAVVCRASRYAGDWIIAPEARLDGEALDVMLFSRRSHMDLLTLFLLMRQARSEHLENGLARIVRGREVEIRSLEPYPVEVEVDGDCVLETPIRCRVGTQTVRILVPKTVESLRRPDPGVAALTV
jgi:YegS/Rv2252/BmrU family lipid kinase